MCERYSRVNKAKGRGVGENLIDLDICTREIEVLFKYRVISTEIDVWTYTPGAYHPPTSIILINHNASSSYVCMIGEKKN